MSHRCGCSVRSTRSGDCVRERKRGAFDWCLVQERHGGCIDSLRASPERHLACTGEFRGESVVWALKGF